MHFSRPCLENLLLRGANIFFIDNQLPLKERTERKTITRSKLNSYSPENPDWFLQSNYNKFQDRMHEIHNELGDICKNLEIPIVKFSTINQAVDCILEKFLSKNS